MPLYESFVGTIAAVGYRWPMPGWALADGSQVPAAQQYVLFVLYGATFGGNGSTTFNLPNMAGVMPMGQGAGRGLTRRTVGGVAGSEATVITTSQMPPHEHPVALGGGTGASGAGMAAAGTGSVQAMPTSVVGEGRPVPLGPPSLVLTYLVALDGIFPPQS